MKDNFNKEISTPFGNTNFQFNSVFYGDEKTYSITFTDENGKPITFRMRRDKEEQWKILAQVLPQWVHEKSAEFANEIEKS